MATTETPQHGMDFGALFPFFAITFALGWGIIALLIFFPVADRGHLRSYGLHQSSFHPGRVLTGHSRHLPGLARLRHQGPRRLPSPPQTVADAPRLVGLPGDRHTRCVLLRRGHQGHHQRSLPLLPLVRRPASPGHGAGHRAH